MIRIKMDRQLRIFTESIICGYAHLLEAELEDGEGLSFVRKRLTRFLSGAPRMIFFLGLESGESIVSRL